MCFIGIAAVVQKFVKVVYIVEVLNFTEYMWWKLESYAEQTGRETERRSGLSGSRRAAFGVSQCLGVLLNLFQKPVDLDW